MFSMINEINKSQAHFYAGTIAFELKMAFKHCQSNRCTDSCWTLSFENLKIDAVHVKRN